MTVYRRYAIYWTPQPGSDLARFGEDWFGGADSFGLSHELAARAIETPARYRIHATLKAPFRLRKDASAETVQAALDGFCARRRQPQAGVLRLARFQRYLALVLKGQTADIDWLADECVVQFDRFRAPIDASDRERRNLGRLNAHERELLEEFGYPFVLSAFRFHISLAGPLSKAELDEVSGALAPKLAPFMLKPFRIEDLSLLGEPEGGGVFEQISRHRFCSIRRF